LARRRRSSSGFFFASENFAHRVARLRDLRPVDLGFLPIAGGTVLPIGAATAAAPQIDAHTLGFIAFERTRMGLFFGYADCSQSLQDFPALDLKLARQIIDSNFTHPPL